MKKNLSKVMLAIVFAFAFLTACSKTATNETTAVETKVEETKVEETTQKETKYKDTLLPFDQLVQGKKLLFLQNTLIYSRDGFYKEDTAPKTEKIDYKGTEVDAYAMNNTTKLLLNGAGANLKVVTTEGNTISMSGEDFDGLYVILGDVTSGNAPTLYNPKTTSEVLNFRYAITDTNEVIYSIVSEEEKNIQELLSEVGWDTSNTYRLMATDYFYVPVEPEIAKTGTLLGALSGAINANLPDIKVMKSGKINDIMYIEELTNVEKPAN